MYSKQETAQLTKTFWTSFGQYLALHQSSIGEKQNWINYRTGIRYIQFRMEADRKQAVISIEITHPDNAIRAQIYSLFQSMHAVLEEHIGELWNWEENITDRYGKVFSSIAKDLQGVDILQKNDWPAIISFLKPRILALDAFWNDVKELFDQPEFSRVG